MTFPVFLRSCNVIIPIIDVFLFCIKGHLKGMCASFMLWFPHILQQREIWAFKPYLPLSTGADLAMPCCCGGRVSGFLVLQKYMTICFVQINKRVYLSSGMSSCVTLLLFSQHCMRKCDKVTVEQTECKHWVNFPFNGSVACFLRCTLRPGDCTPAFLFLLNRNHVTS